jgi:nicotinamidase-related amidase
MQMSASSSRRSRRLSELACLLSPVGRQASLPIVADAKISAGETAVIVVDMLNRYEHEDAEALCDSVQRALPAMRDIVQCAQRGDVPLVYVNDNYGEWGASRDQLSESALGGRRPSLVEPILPPDGVPFVTKARHSVFYETQLDYLLHELGVRRLVLVGQVTEQCILYSALDAYVRHYEIVVPSNAVAHIHRELARAALRMMERNMKAHVTKGQEWHQYLAAP